MSIHKFIKAQDPVWDNVRKELNDGKKQSHWIWFVFPQVKGLSENPSPTASNYAIGSLEQARQYIANETLRDRLHVALKLLMKHQNKKLEDIFPEPDNFKFISSITMFEFIDKDSDIYGKALDCFNDGNRDQASLDILMNLKSEEDNIIKNNTIENCDLKTHKSSLFSIFKNLLKKFSN